MRRPEDRASLKPGTKSSPIGARDTIGTLRRYPDLAVLATLLLLTATLSRSFSQTASLGPIYVTEVAMAIAFCIAIARLGIGGTWRTLRDRLPLPALMVIWVLGIIATLRGLSEFSLSLVSDDIGLFDYTLILPLLALVVWDRKRHEALFAVLVACGLAAMVTFVVVYAAAQITGEADTLLTLQGSAAGLYMSLAVSWIFARLVNGVPTSRWLAALVPIGLVLMALTSQRSVWAMAILALGAVAVLAPRTRRIRVGFATAALLPLAFAAAIGVQAVLTATIDPVKGSTSNFAVTSLPTDTGIPAAPEPDPVPAPEPEPVPSGEPETNPPAEPVAPAADEDGNDGPQLARELTNLGDTDAGESQNVRWRLAYWGELLSRVPDHPILGAGFGEPAEFTWNGLKYDYRDGDPTNTLDVAGPHNGFVSFVYRMGVPALLALLFVIGVAGARVRNALREPGLATDDRVALVTLVAMFAAGTVACSFNEGLTGPFLGLFFWVPLGMLLIWPGTRGAERPGTPA